MLGDPVADRLERLVQRHAGGLELAARGQERPETRPHPRPPDRVVDLVRPRERVVEDAVHPVRPRGQLVETGEPEEQVDAPGALLPAPRVQRPPRHLHYLLQGCLNARAYVVNRPQLLLGKGGGQHEGVAYVVHVHVVAGDVWVGERRKLAFESIEHESGHQARWFFVGTVDRIQAQGGQVNLSALGGVTAEQSS